MELSNNFTELHALVYTLLARIDVLEARVKELEAENTALKARFNASNLRFFRVNNYLALWNGKIFFQKYPTSG